MKAKILALGLALTALVLTACDDTTNGIGGSLTDQADKLNVQTDTFNIGSRSILASNMLQVALRRLVSTYQDNHLRTRQAC